MAVKKVSRKKLLNEPDEFISTTGKVIQFLRENERKLTIYGIIVLVIVAAAAGGYKYLGWQEGKAQAAQQEGLQFYEEAFRKGDNPQGEKEMYGKALAKFEESLKIYHWGRVAQISQVYIGHTFYALKDYDKAASSYSQCLDGPFASSALDGMGYIYEAKGDFNKALEYYLKNMNEKSPYQEEAALGAARCYEALNQKPKALEVYQKTLEKNPKSRMADFMQWKIGDLKG